MAFVKKSRPDADTKNPVVTIAKLLTNDVTCRLLRAFNSRNAAAFLQILQLTPGADLNHQFGENRETLLYMCSKDNKTVNFLTQLLNFGADPNISDANGKTAIHVAAYHSNDEILEVLLNHKATDVNALDKNGCTALHFIVEPSWNIKNKEAHLRCVYLLMNHPKFAVNRPDNCGMTPIATAVLLYYDERVKVMLENGQKRLNIDCSRGSGGKTVREMIEIRFPELIRYLPPVKFESLCDKDPNIRLLAAMQHKNMKIFKECLQQSYCEGEKFVDPNHWYDDPYYSTIIEIACISKGTEDYMRLLLQAGADPNTVNRIHGQPAIHQAAETSNIKALEVLLQTGRALANVRDSSGRTALHSAAQRQCDSAKDIRNTEECISLLLENCSSWNDSSSSLDFRRKIDINAQDEFGDTALHDAAHYSNNSVVLLLLRYGADMMKKNQEGIPPLALMDANIIETYLDDQMRSNGVAAQSDDYQIIMKYDFLRRSAPECKKPDREIEPLIYMSQSQGLRKLLKHPVIVSFLYLKWQNVRGLYYINLLLHTLFVIMITAYILLLNHQDHIYNNAKNCSDHLKHPSEVAIKEMLKRPNINTTLCKTLDSNSEFKLITWCTFSLKILISVCTALILTREIFQALTGMKRYMTTFENYIELSMLVATCGVMSEERVSYSDRQHWSALAILLVWLELVLMTGRLPLLSLQLEMLKRVSLTFAKFMAWYSLLLIAFSLSFYTLFRDEKENPDPFFWNPGLSILKTIVMMSGEFEVNDVPFHVVPITSHLIFTLFVILISIILLNLLNGLAVSDTQAIQSDAVVWALSSMVSLVAYLEAILLKLITTFSCFYRGYLKSFLKVRVRLFSPDVERKQIHIFPTTREVKFLLDSETTERFKTYKMDSDIIQNAISIINRTQEVNEMETAMITLNQLEERLVDIEKSQKRIFDILDTSGKYKIGCRSSPGVYT